MSDQTQPGEIVVSQPTPAPVLMSSILSDEEITRVWRIAKALAASGLFKDVTQAEQAFGRILLGRDLGLSPTQALMGIDVVRGNVQIRSVLLASWVRKHPEYDYAVAEHDDKHCVIDFYYRGETCGQSTFTIEDAQKAGLVKEGSPWKAHPRNMVWARAMSNGVKWFCPDLTGGMAIYTEADSFEDRHESIGTGEGDGSGPGWGDMDPALVERVEQVIARAGEAGLPAFASAEVIQVRLGGQPAEVVEEWLSLAEGQLAAVEVPDAEVVEPEPTGEAFDPENESGHVDEGDEPETLL